MGIFNDKADLFTTYRAKLQFRNRLMGGVPKDPKIIEGWLRAKAGITQDEEVRHKMVQTLIELGAELDPNETDMDRIIEASKTVAESKKTQGFKQNGKGLYVEGRQFKAMLKEVVNCLYAYPAYKWGPTKKSPRAFVAEHVFTEPDEVLLGFDEPTGVEMVIGHVNGAGGQRATLTYVEYVHRPTVEVDYMVDRVAGAELTDKQWAELWCLAQENAFGALRSQGYGKFDIVGWKKLKKAKK